MRLTTRQVEKVWGRDVLPRPFSACNGKRIGEIWFEPPAELPELLVKYIFTSEKLSVQVHPNNEQTQAAGLGHQGKEECWLVLDAEPGAQLGIGFKESVDDETMRVAALDGSIEELLDWQEVKAGDFFLIPAGVVHAIGEGVSIIEIQQNSDITFRMFDYGRPRELHLDEAIEVADGKPLSSANVGHLPAAGHAALVDGEFFRLDWVDGIADESLLYSYSNKTLIMPIKEVVLMPEGVLLEPGECGLVPDLASATFAPNGKALVAAPVG